MSTKLIAINYYKFYSKLEGNQHIANLYAIQKILDILKFHKPKSILEVGLGIGSICYSVLDYSEKSNHQISYFGTESNTFCLNALKQNLKNYYTQLNLHKNIKDIDKNIFFDFVIVDGSDDALESVSRLICKNGIIFIEGDRKKQQEVLLNLFPKHKLAHTISNFKEPKYGPFKTGDWSGGGKLIFINPTIKQYLHWSIEKLRSAYRYRFVRRKK